MSAVDGEIVRVCDVLRADEHHGLDAQTELANDRFGAALKLQKLRAAMSGALGKHRDDAPFAHALLYFVHDPHQIARIGAIDLDHLRKSDDFADDRDVCDLLFSDPADIGGMGFFEHDDIHYTLVVGDY